MISTCLLPKFRLLILLLAVDAVFIALYGLYGFKFVTDPKFGLIEDWSYGEVFQYIKEFWIVLLLLLVAIQLGSWRYATWVGVFGYLLLDDSCQIHELAGTKIHQWFGIDAWGSLSGQNFGELVFMLAVGGIVASLVGASLWRADRHYLRVATILFGMLGAFAFFSIIVDQLYFGGHWLVDKALGALEDGGEQVVMSVITWYVFQLSLQEKHAA